MNLKFPAPPPAAPAPPPIHPGEILRDDFADALGLDAQQLAEHTGIPIDRLGVMLSGGCRIEDQDAIALAATFGTTASFWMNLQSSYDLGAAIA